MPWRGLGDRVAEWGKVAAATTSLVAVVERAEHHTGREPRDDLGRVPPGAWTRGRAAGHAVLEAHGHRWLGLAVDHPRPVPGRHALGPERPEAQGRARLSR